MAWLGDLVLRLKAETADFQQDLGRAAHIADQSMRKIDRAAKDAMSLLGVGVAAWTVKESIEQMTKAAVEAEESINRLNAVFQATGATVGITRQELHKMADDMANATKFDDEAVRNATAIMLTFSTVQGDTFRQAMKLSADLAALLGTDLQSAASKVGRALEDPIHGLTALRKAGIMFSDAQRKTIEDLLETGNRAGATEVILKALETRIGGVAEAMNTGLSQAVNDAKKSWNEMLEAVGRTETFSGTVGGILTSWASYLRDIKQVIEDGDWIDKLAFFTVGIKTPSMQGPQQDKFDFNAYRQADRAAMRQRDATNDASWQVGFDKQQKELDKFVEVLKKKAEQSAKTAEKLRDDMRRGDEESTDRWYQSQRDAEYDFGQWKLAQSKERESLINKANMENLEAFARSVDERAEVDAQIGQMGLNERIKGTQEEARRAADMARALGMTFSSAFEDAVIKGKSLQDVLKGIADDLLRLALRKTVTEPMAGIFTKALSSINWFGGASASPEAGASYSMWGERASGGPVYGGGPYMVGERGPEMFVPRGNGDIIPNNRLGGISINQTLSFGSDVNRATMIQWASMIKEQTIAAVVDGNRRARYSFS